MKDYRITWTPGSTDLISYERAEFNGKSLLVWEDDDGLFEINIAGFPYGGTYRTADEAKDVAIREAAQS